MEEVREDVANQSVGAVIAKAVIDEKELERARTYLME